MNFVIIVILGAQIGFLIFISMRYIVDKILFIIPNEILFIIAFFPVVLFLICWCCTKIISDESESATSSVENLNSTTILDLPPVYDIAIESTNHSDENSPPAYDSYMYSCNMSV